MDKSSGKPKKDDSAVLLLANTLMWSAMGVHTPFINSFYAVKGLASFEIGILSAITPILAILVQPFWAYLSDRTGRRKAVLILITVASALAIQGYGMGNTFLFFAAETLLFGAFNTSVLPLSDALVSNYGRRSRIGFARIRMGGTIGFAAVTLIFGNVISGNTDLIFPVAGAAYLILALCYSRLPDDRAHGESRKPSKGRIFKDNRVVFLFFLAFLVQFGMSISGFYSVYVIGLGYRQSVVGLSSCVSALSELPVLFFAERMLRRFRIDHLMVFSVFMNALRLLLGGSGALPLMIGGQMLQSATYMIPYYCCITFINENVMEGKISQGQTCLTMVQQGLAMVTGSLAGGAISGAVGLKYTFMSVAAGLTLMGGLSILIGKRIFSAEPGPGHEKEGRAGRKRN